MDTHPTHEQRSDLTPEQRGEETIDAPVMDGADELQAEAEAALGSGEVDPSDTRLGGPTVLDEPGARD